MKRLLSLALVTACALALAASCAKPEPQIDIDMSHDFSVSGLSETITLSFISNTDWVVSSSENWCKPSPAAGSGSGKTANVTLSVAPNPSYEPRSAKITIKAGDVEKTVTLKQDPAIGILVDNATVEVPAEGGRISIPIKSNIDYAINASDNWITISNASSVPPTLQDHLIDYVIELHCAGNPTGEMRTATVTLEGPYGVAATITVVQLGSDKITINYIWNSQDDTKIENRQIEARYSNWSANIGCYYTAIVTLDTPDPDLVLLPSDDAKDWISESYDSYYSPTTGEYSIYFQVAANTENAPRTGHFRIATRDGSEKSAEITVNQTALPDHAIYLGTEVYWHEFNLGAGSPEELGDYYAWGELETKTAYTWDNYNCAGGDKYSKVDRSNGGYSYTPNLWNEHDPSSQQLSPEFVRFGAHWGMPYPYEVQQLLDTRNSPETHKWEWKTKGGVRGWEITYLVNGKSIFLPAGGYKWGDALEHPELGMYWTKEAVFANQGTPSVSATNLSRYLRFGPGTDGEVAIYEDGQRAAGMLIRPVTR